MVTWDMGPKTVLSSTNRVCHSPGPSKGCPMDYSTLPIGFHWAPLRGSWHFHLSQRLLLIFNQASLNHSLSLNQQSRLTPPVGSADLLLFAPPDAQIRQSHGDRRPRSAMVGGERRERRVRPGGHKGGDGRPRVETSQR